MLEHFCKDCHKKESCTFPCDEYITKEFNLQWTGNVFDKTREEIFDDAQTEALDTEEPFFSEEERKEKTLEEYILIYHRIKSNPAFRHDYPLGFFIPKK